MESEELLSKSKIILCSHFIIKGRQIFEEMCKLEKNSFHFGLTFILINVKMKNVK